MRLTLSAIVGVALLAITAAQAPDPQTRRINDRIRALQTESERLARQSQTLIVELRQLEIDRDLRIEEAMQAEAASMEAQQALDAASERLAALEQQRIAQLPDLKTQLVDL